MKMHASTDDNDITRFMIEHEDGSRTTFAAHVVEAELRMDYDYGDFLDHMITRMARRSTTFDVSVQVIGDVTRVAAPVRPYEGMRADYVIMDETQKELP